MIDRCAHAQLLIVLIFGAIDRVREFRGGAMHKTVVAGVLGVSLLVTGCATDGKDTTMNKETVGTVLGAVIGGVVGSKFGKGKGQLIATAIGAAAGAYAGNMFGASLDEADRLAVEKKTAEALGSVEDGKTVAWSNPDSGASATITPQDTHTETRKVTLLRDKRIAPLPTLELIGETWEATTNANVRSAPSLDGEVVSGLQTGETFTAVGKVEGHDWIVVGQGKRTVGYVASSLVQKATLQTASEQPASDSSPLRAAVDLDALANDQAIDLDAEGLVAEEVVASSTCRNMNVSITAKDGDTEQQQMKACKAGDGAWEIL